MKVWIAPVENPWTSNPALNGVEVNTTDPNGFNYTSTWELIDRSNPDMAQYLTPEILLDSNKLYVGFVAGMPGDWKNGNAHWNTAAGGAYGNFKVSKFSQLFRQNSHPLLKAMIMNSDELQFILAEAAAKKYDQREVLIPITAMEFAFLWSVGEYQRLILILILLSLLLLYQQTRLANWQRLLTKNGLGCFVYLPKLILILGEQSCRIYSTTAI